MVESGLWGMKMMFYEGKVTHGPSKAGSAALQSYVNNGTFEPSMQITMRKLKLRRRLLEVHPERYLTYSSAIMTPQGASRTLFDVVPSIWVLNLTS